MIDKKEGGLSCVSEYKDGKKDGCGRIYLENGKLGYVGHFKNKLLHGTGTGFIDKEQSKHFVGQFSNNLKIEGVFTDEITGSVYFDIYSPETDFNNGITFSGHQKPVSRR